MNRDTFHTCNHQKKTNVSVRTSRILVVHTRACSGSSSDSPSPNSAASKSVTGTGLHAWAVVTTVESRDEENNDDQPNVDPSRRHHSKTWTLALAARPRPHTNAPTLSAPRRAHARPLPVIPAKTARVLAAPHVSTVRGVDDDDAHGGGSVSATRTQWFIADTQCPTLVPFSRRCNVSACGMAHPSRRPDACAVPTATPDKCPTKDRFGRMSCSTPRLRVLDGQRPRTKRSRGQLTVRHRTERKHTALHERERTYSAQGYRAAGTWTKPNMLRDPSPSKRHSRTT